MIAWLGGVIDGIVRRFMEDLDEKLAFAALGIVIAMIVYGAAR